jgi:carbon storage regulator CsrA
MLALNRQKNEKIIITTEAGERIEVVVVEIRGAHAVRLGFEAPKSVKINREEIETKVESK